MKQLRLEIVVVLFILGILVPALAEEPVLHRASSIGGTGMMFSRVGDQLYEREMNAGVYINYLTFGHMPLYPEALASSPFVNDPRGSSDLIMTLYYNYGILRRLEAGIQIPARFLQDTYPESGLERISLDARYLIISPDFNFGLGVSGTGWASFPSFTNNITSTELNGGAEIAATVHGKGFDDSRFSWFMENVMENLYIHVSLGAGYGDYLKFHKLPVPIISNGQRLTRDPNRPEFVGTPFMSVTAGAQFEVYDNLLIGAEYLGTRWPEYANDENCHIMFPEIAYTFSGKSHWSIQAGFGMGCDKLNNQPQYIAAVDLSVHIPGKSPYPTVAPPPPPPPVIVEAAPPPPPPPPPPVIPTNQPHRLPIPATDPMPPPIAPDINTATRMVVLPSNFPETRISLIASDVSSVKALEHSGATRIIIKTNGPVGAYDDFLLIEPNRLAIDVYNVAGSFNFPSVGVNSREVNDMRWGPHPDKEKVRIVLDLPDGNLPYYTVKKMPRGVEVIVYSSLTISNAPLEDYDTYTVSNNTTAAAIAEEVYGDPRVWRRIAASNPEVYDYHDPFPQVYATQELEPGTKLRIPKRNLKA